MKRFYNDVSVTEADDGWQVVLDQRAVRTAAGAPQIVPTRELAKALAEEWRAQGEEIDLAAFPLRDLADAAIDRIASDRKAAIAALLRFAQTDTLCYRADEGDALHDRQLELWEPLLAKSEARHGVRFTRIHGIAQQPQPPAIHERLSAALDGFDAFTLSALTALAPLAGSLIVALTALDRDTDARELFAAANLEEDWQAVQWGWDTLALQDRDRREADFTQAARFARMAAGKD